MATTAATHNTAKRTKVVEAFVVCPTCKGTKEQTVQFTDEHGKESSLVMGCVICQKTGRIAKRTLEAMDAFWCKCEDVDAETEIVFVDDNQRADCRKHHFRHSVCGRVVQVG